MKKLYTLIILLVLVSTTFQSLSQIVYKVYSPSYDLWYRRVADVQMVSTLRTEYIINADRDDTSHYIRITSNYGHQVMAVMENGRNLPKVLNYGDPINSSSADWVSIPLGPPTEWFYLVSRGNPGHSNFGYWFGKTDKYLGVRFNQNGDWYYGWIQLTISTDTTGTAPNKLIARAFNGTPGGFLTAGQQSSGINELLDLSGIYSEGKSINCRFNDNLTGKLMVMNCMGQVVYEMENPAAETKIDLSGQATGVYIINVVSGNQSVSKKIWLN